MGLIDDVKLYLPLQEYIRQSCVIDKFIKIGKGKTRINPCPLCGHNDCATIRPDESFFCYSTACESNGSVLDVVGFASKIEGIPDQFECAKLLASRFAIGGNGGSPSPASIPSPPPQKSAVSDFSDDRDPWVDSDKASELRKWAASVYHQNLLSTPQALQYQTEIRHHQVEFLCHEQVGYGNRNLINAANSDQIDLSDLVRIGLISIDKNGKHREYIPKGAYVYPHYSNGRCIRFTLKHNKAFQVKKIFRDSSSLCWGQDSFKAKSFIICEGENDRLSILENGGKNCAAIIGNESTKIIANYLRENLSSDKTVWLWFDGNDAGKKYTQIFSRSCSEAGATVKIIPVDWGRDPDDMLGDSDDPKAFLADLCRSASVIQPPDSNNNGGGGSYKPNKWLSDEFNSFDVLCALPGRFIAFFDKENRIVHEVSIKDLDQKCLSLIGGPDVSFRVVRSKSDAEEIPGSILFTTFVQDIICEARSKTKPKLERVGLGIHPIDDGRLLINNGPDAWIYDPTHFTFESHDYPLLDNLMISFHPNRRLVDMRKVIDRVQSMTPDKARSIRNDFLGWIKQWGFQGLMDADCICGWILAQIVQKIWDWRPNLGLYGQAETGKTIFHTFIESIFGHFHLEMEGRGLTEPAFRQTIADSSRLVFIDEFEKSKHRKVILETLRSSSRGITKYIGSSTGGGSIPFTLKHMVLLSAIEKGIIREADTSRIISIETIKDPSRKPKMPSLAVSKQLRIDLISLALWAGPQAKKLIRKLSAKMDRSKEALSVPFAMISVFEADPEKELMDNVGAYLEDVSDRSEGSISDSDALIETILSSRIRIAEEIVSGPDVKTIYSEPSVSSLLEISSNGGLTAYQDTALQSSGLKITPRGDVFMAPQIISRHLLSRTDWRDMAISDILARIPGAQRAQLRLAGLKAFRGIVVPRAFIS